MNLNNKRIQNSLIYYINSQKNMVNIKQKIKDNKNLTLNEVKYLQKIKTNYKSIPYLTKYFSKYINQVNKFYEKYNTPVNIYDAFYLPNINIENDLNIYKFNFGDIILFGDDVLVVNVLNKRELLPSLNNDNITYIWSEKYSNYVNNIEKKLKNVFNNNLNTLVNCNKLIYYFFVNPNDKMIKRLFGSVFSSTTKCILLKTNNNNLYNLFIVKEKVNVVELTYNGDTFAVNNKPINKYNKLHYINLLNNIIKK